MEVVVKGLNVNNISEYIKLITYIELGIDKEKLFTMGLINEKGESLVPLLLLCHAHIMRGFKLRIAAQKFKQHYWLNKDVFSETNHFFKVIGCVIKWLHAAM